jgi:hypothetical protein
MYNDCQGRLHLLSNHFCNHPCKYGYFTHRQRNIFFNILDNIFWVYLKFFFYTKAEWNDLIFFMYLLCYKNLKFDIKINLLTWFYYSITEYWRTSFCRKDYLLKLYWRCLHFGFCQTMALVIFCIDHL